jgi:hypothetical protein
VSSTLPLPLMITAFTAGIGRMRLRTDGSGMIAVYLMTTFSRRGRAV